MWRQVLEVGDTVDRLVVAGRVLLSLSSGGKYVRGWSMRDGNLLWEHAVYTAAAPSADAAAENVKDRGVDLLPLGRDVDGDGADDLLVLARGQVQLRSLSDGVVAWISESADAFDKETVRLRRVAVAADGAFVAFGVTEGDGNPAAIEIDPKDGSTRRAVVSAAANGLDDAPAAVKTAADGAVWVSGVARDGAKAYAADVSKILAGKRGAATVFDLPAELGDVSAAAPATMEPLRGADDASDAVALAAGAATIRARDACALVVVDPDGGKGGHVRVLRSWPTLAPGGGCSAAVSPPYAVNAGDATGVVGIVAAAADASSYVVERVSLADGVVADGGAFRSDGYGPDEHGAPVRAWITGAEAHARALLRTADASLASLGGDASSSSSAAWSREEALAVAGEVSFARLPPPKSAAAAAADDLRVRPSFEERYRAQLLAAKARFKTATPEEIQELAALRRGRGNKLLPTRDVNGFRRQIIALAPNGALVSLHNGDGRALWRRFLGAGLDPAGGPASAYSYSAIFSWRPSGEHSHDAEHALIFGTARDGGDGTGANANANARTRAVVVDLYTGEVESDAVLPYAVAHVLPLPSAAAAEDHHEPSATLLVDASEARAHVFPDTEEARLAAYADRSRMSFYTVDQTRAEVRGYTFLPAAFGAGSFDASHAWTAKFPAEVGDIVGYAAKPANEVVNSWVRVLGDRSTLFKYLSPNVIFVAAAPKNAAPEESAVSVHLLDAATGRVLYRVRHADARGPVHAVVCENWVVYHYFNTKAGRHAMSVLEMFDDAEHRKGAAVGDLMYASLVGRNETETTSSMAPPPLRIMGQSYYVRPAATMMTATYSAKGVTAHQVLMGTNTDQVVAVDKRFLDPRRPTKPTREDREEGLVPYAEVLPIFPNSWVTTKHQVARLRGIKTAPAELESTVLCVAHGLDFFYTRLHPSRSYDMLDEEFSYLLLIVTLAALAGGAIITQGFAVAKDLDRKWK